MINPVDNTLEVKDIDVKCELISLSYSMVLFAGLSTSIINYNTTVFLVDNTNYILQCLII